MKTKSENNPRNQSARIQELCQELKGQLDNLATSLEAITLPDEEKNRRTHLMEQLKKQLAELSR